MREQQLREEVVSLGRSLYQRGYAAGGAGNLSVRVDEHHILATPTGSSLGRLRSQDLSLVDTQGTHLSGLKPSKEVRFHLALYADSACNAVVHLHSTWTTLLACRADIDPQQIIRPFTPYYVMKLGKVELIPYYPPGDDALTRELGRWAGRRHAFLLQNHGPVITGRSLSAAMDLMEEFEETAKLSYLLQGSSVRYLSEEEIAFLRNR